MLYDDKAFYIFVTDDEFHNKKMYYKDNELNGRLIISYYKKDNDIVIKINYPNKEILSKDVNLEEYELITKYYIERIESNGYEEYPTTYERIYGLGIYKKFFVNGYTPDMESIKKYLEYDYLEYDELDTIAENKKELSELQELYKEITMNFNESEFLI